MMAEGHGYSQPEVLRHGKMFYSMTGSKQHCSQCLKRIQCNLFVHVLSTRSSDLLPTGFEFGRKEKLLRLGFPASMLLLIRGIRILTLGLVFCMANIRMCHVSDR